MTPLEARSESRKEAPRSPSAAVSISELVRDPARLASWIAEHAYELQAARARVDQARADVGQSGVFPNPVLGLSLGDIALGKTNPEGLKLGDTAIYGVGISEMIELGKRGPRTESARLRRDAEEEGYRGSFADRVADARLALGRVAYLHARQGVLTESLAAARRVLELEKVRVEKGDLSANDHDRLMLEALSLEAEVARGQSDYEAARATCAALLLAPCAEDDTDFHALAGMVAVPELEKGEDPTEVLSRRPDVRALALAAESARADAVLASRKIIPDPTLGVGYTRDKLVISGDQPHTLGFTLSVPLNAFDRGQHDEEKAEARAVELERTREALLVRARADLSSIEDRRARLEAAHEDLLQRGIPASRGVLDTMLKALHVGQVSMTDFLLAEKSHKALLLGALDLGFDVFTARNDLRRVLAADAEAGR